MAPRTRPREHVPFADPLYLGDIVIARGVARRQARAAGHSERTELRILALHGLLHLLGYDHERDEGAMARAERALRRKGGLPATGLESSEDVRVDPDSARIQAMIPLSLFLLACVAVYLGAIEAAFSALMRLSLRLSAERSDRPGALADYLDDPILLFAPVRLLLASTTAAATALLARGDWHRRRGPSHVGPHRRRRLPAGLPVAGAVAHRRPRPGARARTAAAHLQPGREGARAHRAVDGAGRRPSRSVLRQRRPRKRPPRKRPKSTKAYLDTGEQEGIIEGEERRLLQSIVDFGDTLVREVMTPRPDIVGIPEHATIGDLRALFREQEYSRFPGLQGEPRQHRRLRLRQGSRRAQPGR